MLETGTYKGRQALGMLAFAPDGTPLEYGNEHDQVMRQKIYAAVEQAMPEMTPLNIANAVDNVVGIMNANQGAITIDKVINAVNSMVDASTLMDPSALNSQLLAVDRDNDTFASRDTSSIGQNDSVDAFSDRDLDGNPYNNGSDTFTFDSDSITYDTDNMPSHEDAWNEWQDQYGGPGTQIQFGPDGNPQLSYDSKDVFDSVYQANQQFAYTDPDMVPVVAAAGIMTKGLVPKTANAAQVAADLKATGTTLTPNSPATAVTIAVATCNLNTTPAAVDTCVAAVKTQALHLDNILDTLNGDTPAKKVTPGTDPAVKPDEPKPSGTKPEDADKPADKPAVSADKPTTPKPMVMGPR